MTSTGARKLFVNLPVANLDKSVDFFTKLGFTFDARFTDENATAMIVNDDAVVMLLVQDRFQDFTKKQLVDATKHTEAIMALSAESRDDVDAFADSRPAVRPRTTRCRWTSCTGGASRISTVISGRSSG